ncbi:MAG: A/G-specific adenine glycosylase [Candidatus Sericytochromatia bacterium]
MTSLDPRSFAADLLAWFAGAAREMPWRESKDPYRIWISEIMLQQTQVNTVRPYFQRFIAAFPTVQDLATAPLERVLKLWEGLGYYSRARNLHRGAQYVVEHFQGRIPASPEAIRQIPGIGPYSAGAILSIAFDLPEPAVDGNVIRVFSRLDAIVTPFDTASSRNGLEARVKALIPARAGDFNQALMELGALICTPAKPDCPVCPVRSHCRAFAQGHPESYPVKVKKTKVRTVAMAVALIRDTQGRVLIQQQGHQGIFRQLWCLPWIEQGEREAEAALAGVLPADFKLLGHLGTVAHTMTHRQLEMAVYVCQSEQLTDPLPSGWAWLDPEQNPDYAVPVAHQKILAYVAAHPLLLQMYL